MNCHNCLRYVAGLLAVFAYDDISYNKIATQSDTYNGMDYVASNAVDRNTTTCMRTDPIGVRNLDKTTWWKVDLGGVSSIYSVNIQFKSYDGYVDRQKGRLAGFSLYVSNSDAKSSDAIKKSTLCYKDGPVLPPLNLTKVCSEYGRYVIFYNERLDGIVYPKGYVVANVFTELCEVIVQGCNNASVYGSKCDKPCPPNCKDNTCHIQNGTCFLCKPGWSGLDCDMKCSKGWFGMNCAKQCVGQCRDGVTCNHVTGLCDIGCAAGWKGDLCNKECNDGTYGYNCANSCSCNCLNESPCNKQTGLCDRGCNPGYTDSNCSKECLPGYFGIDCSRKCSGYCINNEPCDHVSGVCPSGCQDGFYGTLCNNSCNEGFFGTHCSRVCSPNCQHGQCRHTDGSCTSCVEGWMGGNCTTECFGSYGVNCQYTCSVHCIKQTCDRINGSCLLGCGEDENCGCKASFYGSKCDKPCPSNCKDNTCHIQTGTCFLCKAGWSGSVCDIKNVLEKKWSISSSIMLAIGLSVSILINIIFVVCGILLWRRNKSSKGTLFGKLLSRWKTSFYQDIVAKNDETSTYQELDLSDSAYQNTAIP